MYAHRKGSPISPSLVSAYYDQAHHQMVYTSQFFLQNANLDLNTNTTTNHAGVQRKGSNGSNNNNNTAEEASQSSGPSSLSIIEIEDFEEEWNNPIQVAATELLPPVKYKTLTEGKSVLKEEEIERKNDNSRKQEDAKEEEEPILYDMDESDATWLISWNLNRKLHGLPILEEAHFEAIIHHLEFLYFAKEKSVLDAELTKLGIRWSRTSLQDMACDVCRDPDSEETNELFACEICKCVVHQACYGVENVPEGRWICQTCRLPSPVSCVLCPNTGGLMKKTVQGDWVHSSCALWIPETAFDNVIDMEPVVGIDEIPKDRWQLQCSLCKIKSGACVQCSYPSCFLAFHVTCAMQKDLSMTIRERNGEVINEVFCLKHTPRKIKKIQDDDESENTPERETHRCIEYSPQLVQPMEIVSRLPKGVPVDEEALKAAYSRWILKRKMLNGRPLLAEIRNTANVKRRNMNYRSNGQEYDQKEVLQCLKTIKSDLEKAREISRLICLREDTKLRAAKINEELFKVYKKKLRISLESCLKKLLAQGGFVASLEKINSGIGNTSVNILSERIRKYYYNSFATFRDDVLQLLENPNDFVANAAPSLDISTVLSGDSGNRRTLRSRAGSMAADIKIVENIISESTEYFGKPSEIDTATIPDVDIPKIEIDPNNKTYRVGLKQVIRRRLLELIDILRKFDRYSYFQEPVDPAIAPNYFDIIKYPMDFSKMKRKCEDGEYDENFPLFQKDFLAICNNCMTYNYEGSVVFEEASRLLQKGQKKISAFVEQFNDIFGLNAIDFTKRGKKKTILLLKTSDKGGDVSGSDSIGNGKPVQETILSLFKKAEKKARAISNELNSTPSSKKQHGTPGKSIALKSPGWKGSRESDSFVDIASITPEKPPQGTKKTPILTPIGKGGSNVTTTPSDSAKRKLTISLSLSTEDQNTSTPTPLKKRKLQDRYEDPSTEKNLPLLTDFVDLLPPMKTLLQLLDRLILLDSFGYFVIPVDPEDVPDYYDIVKNPMNFKFMLNKLRKGEYGDGSIDIKSLDFQKFVDDFHLIISNAKLYNDLKSDVLKQALHLEELGNELIKQCTIDAKRSPSKAYPKRNNGEIITTMQHQNLTPNNPLSHIKPSDISLLLEYTFCLERQDMYSMYFQVKSSLETIREKISLMEFISFEEILSEFMILRKYIGEGLFRRGKKHRIVEQLHEIHQLFTEAFVRTFRHLSPELAAKYEENSAESIQ